MLFLPLPFDMYFDWREPFISPGDVYARAADKIEHVFKLCDFCTYL